MQSIQELGLQLKVQCHERLLIVQLYQNAISNFDIREDVCSSRLTTAGVNNMGSK
jgi:hypothetical protein